ncbi:hypothetical protein [Parachryseolinea silvisoli]|uniref:hypothetical protein n=1 Tax=Parachryseolinea silvisoli TaxID=2873601 RepID=UPI002265F44A|nr:hypothetical protein [Parachryseolinea silvisoli]MCD9014606.1 hypothetical protein [Parachryseolinea silvisoli]
MRLVITIFLTVLSLATVAQGDMRVDQIVDRTSGRYNEFQPKPEKIESVYLHDDWVNGTLMLLSGDTLADLSLKYDIKNSLLEINTPAGIKVASLSKIKGFELAVMPRKQLFLNANRQQVPGLTGLVEVLAKGNTSLYAKPSVEIIAGNYNAALDVGSRGDKAIKKEDLFLVKDGKATDVTRAGKKVVGQFQGREADIEKYVKDNHLSYKKKDDLARIIRFANEGSAK